MNDLELCKKFAELEGVELVESFGKIHDASKLGKYGSEYNPITDLALNCAARDKYKVEIDYMSKYISIFRIDDRGLTRFSSDMHFDDKPVCRAVIECILKSEGLLCAAAKQ